MTELTLDKQLEQFPNVTRFICMQGIEWKRDNFSIMQDDNDAIYIHKNCFKYCSIPGLRPKPRMVKKTVKVFAFVDLYGLPWCYNTDKSELEAIKNDTSIIVELTGEYEVEE